MTKSTLAERLLALILPQADREVVIAELAELYDARGDGSGSGPRAWYWRQLASFSNRLIQEWLSEKLKLPVASREVERSLGGNLGKAPSGGRGGVSRITEPLLSLLADFVHALRTIRRCPSLVLAAVLTLALGIGVNTIVFSVVDVLMLHPLPYEDSERLLDVYGVSEERGLSHQPLSIPDFSDLRAESRTMEVAAWFPANYNLAGGETPERVQALRVSADFFKVLRANLVAGREFTVEEEHFGRHRVAIVSEGLRDRTFGSGESAIGRTLRLDGESYTVVGIVPNDFAFAHNNTPLWTPLGIREDEDRSTRKVEVFARLNPGADVAQARTEVRLLADGLSERHRDSNAGWGADVRPLRQSLFPDVVQSVSTILLVAVGFVLLIACANVANLMLARADSRGREIAVRSALGAGRTRLVRLLLAEAAVISVAGGALGLLAAFLGIRGVLAFVFPEPVPGVGSVDVNSRVLLFTCGVTGFTTLLFGLGPAIHGSAHNLVDALKSGSTSSTSAQRGRVRKLLVVSQISLALALLVASGLLIKAFVQLHTMEFGFDHENLFTFRVTLPEADYPNPEAVSGFHLTLLDRLAAIPYAASVSGASSLPLHSVEHSEYSLPGFDMPANRPTPRAARRAVLPGYFETMRLDMISGRTIDRSDGFATPPVAVVNKAMAKRHWRDESPLGKQITLHGRTHEIVGVVENAINQLGPDVEPIVYSAGLQELPGGVVYVVRIDSDQAGLLDAVRREVAQADPNLAVYGARMMTDQVNAGLLEVGIVVSLMLLAATIAVLLALTGVYGVVSYSVAQRTRELGIRMALGAGGRAIVGMILRQGGALAAVGLVCGAIFAVLLTKGMSGMLFGVSATDPFVFGAVLAAVFLICVVASYMPAKRASRVDPLEAIRYE